MGSQWQDRTPSAKRGDESACAVGGMVESRRVIARAAGFCLFHDRQAPCFVRYWEALCGQWIQ